MARRPQRRARSRLPRHPRGRLYDIASADVLAVRCVDAAGDAAATPPLLIWPNAAQLGPRVDDGSGSGSNGGGGGGDEITVSFLHRAHLTGGDCGTAVLLTAVLRVDGARAAGALLRAANAPLAGAVPLLPPLLVAVTSACGAVSEDAALATLLRAAAAQPGTARDAPVSTSSASAVPSAPVAAAPPFAPPPYRNELRGAAKAAALQLRSLLSEWCARLAVHMAPALPAAS